MFNLHIKKINYRASLLLFLPWLGVILIFIFVIIPHWQTYDFFKNQIAAKTPTIKADYAEAMNLKKVVEQESGEVLGQKRHFADSGDNLVFITALETLASSTNVKVELNFLSPTASDSRYQILPLTLNATGRYSDLLNYLNGLENFDYYVTISSFTLNKKALNKAQTEEDNYSLFLTVKSYWRK